MMFSRWLKRLFGLRNRLSRRRIKRRPHSTPQVTWLEDRVTPAVTTSFAAGTLTLTLGAANDVAFLQMDGAKIDVGTTSGAEDVLANQAGVTRIVLQDGGTNAGQSVTFTAGSGPFSLTTGLSSTDVETVTFNQDVDTATAALSVTAPRNIVVGGNLSTTSGNITLDADSGTQVGGAFIGVNVSGNVTTTGGTIQIDGRGGSDAGGAQHGVRVAATVSTGGAGTVTLNGTGGATAGSINYGVFADGGAALITSAGGAVTVTGLGGGTGASATNAGVRVEGGATITAGGAGAVTVGGTGGATTGNDNLGVFVSDAGSKIISGGGTVGVTGVGGGTGASSFNHGVIVQNAGLISAGGASAVTVNGTGGQGAGNIGVYVTGTGSKVTSSGGTVGITGLGGGTGASSFNHGVRVDAKGVISAGGAGAVTVNGTGGAGTGGTNVGVNVDGVNSAITSGTGSIGVTGAAGAGAGSVGFALVAAAKVFAGANGTLLITTDTLTTDAGTKIGGTSNGTQTINNSGKGTVDGVIDGVGAQFVKQGAGTLTLTAANTYTGATSVDGGRLNVNGSISSITTVNAAGTLGGTGSITGDVSGAGTFAPGLSPGQMTINGNFTPTGTVQLEVNPPAATAGTDYDQYIVNGTVDLSGATLTFSGSASPPVIAPGTVVTLISNDLADATVASTNPANLTIVNINGNKYTINYNAGAGGNDVILTEAQPPTLVSFADDDADNSVPPGQLITYTVTFSEDIDDTTVSATDFVNAGTAAVIFGTITETGANTGVFTVQVTPTNEGTVQLRIPTSADIRDTVGNKLDVTTAIDDPTVLISAKASVTEVAGDLVFADNAGIDDTVTISFDGTNYTITSTTGKIGVSLADFPGATGNGTNSVVIPQADFTGNIIFNTNAGNDQLTVSYGATGFSKTVTFNGGAQTTGDKLTLLGGNPGAVTYNYTNANDGSIVTTNLGTVNYTGLEPVLTDFGTPPTTAIFNLPAGGSVAFLEDDGTAGNSKLQLRSAPTTFEVTTFTAPSVSLTINRGNATDTLTMTDIADFTAAANLIVGSAGKNFASASFDGDATVTNLSVFATTITNTANATISATGAASFSGTTVTLGTTAGDSFNFGTLSFTSAGTVTIDEDSATTLAGANTAATLNLTPSGAIDDGAAASVVVTGTATLNAGANAITLNNTAHDFNNLNVTGSTVTVVDNATGFVITGAAASTLLDLTSDDAVAQTGVINGGAVTFQGPGTLTLSQANTYSGTTTVNAGTVVVTNAAGLGTTAGGTTVASGATLDVQANIGTEPLSVGGDGVGGNGALVTSAGAGTVGGAVTLTADTKLGGAATLNINGAIGGAFNVIKVGAGTTTFAGANTYTGTTTVNAGTLSLAGGAAIADAGAVIVNAGTLNLAASETIGSLAGAAGSAVTLNANTLTTGDATNTNYAGTISGAGGNLVKQGAGTLTLSGANTYTGTTTVNAGTLELSGSITSNTTVAAGAFLTTGATGTVTGDVTAATGAPGGTVAPGGTGIGALGKLSVTNFTLSDEAVLRVDVNGPASETNFDQVIASGTVTVTGADLSVPNVGTPTFGSSYTIVNNTGLGAIVGTFDGLPEGAVFAPSGKSFQITYQGGVGSNDIVLTAIDPTNPIINGTPGNDNYYVRKVGGVVQVFSGVDSTGALIFSNLLTSLTTLQFNGLAGNDTVTVDYSDDALTNTADNEYFTLPITFAGGTNTGGVNTKGTVGDGLFLIGATSAAEQAGSSVAHQLNNAAVAADEFDGQITITDTNGTASTPVINYTGVGTVVDGLTATGRTITSTIGGNETLTLTVNGIAAGVSSLKSTTGTTDSATVRFTNPTGSLTVNAGAGDDTVTVAAGLATAFGANLTLNGDANTDVVNLNADVTLAAGKNLAVNAETTNTGAGADLITSGTGVFTITSDNVALDLTSTLQAAALVTIVPQTAARPIDLGVLVVSAGELELSDGELDRITTSILRVGDATSGAITVTDTISPANIGALSLQSAGTVSQNASKTITVGTGAGDLAVRAGGAVTLDQGNQAGTFAATTPAGTISYLESAAGVDLSVGNVDGVFGVSTTNATITLTTTDGSLTVTDSSAATDVNAGTATVSLTAGQTGAAVRTLNVNANAVVRGTAGVTFTANDMVINTTGTTSIDAGTSTAILQNEDAGRPIELGATAPANELELTDAELDRITAGTLTIGRNDGLASGAIDVTEPIDLTDAPAIGTLNLRTGAAVLGSGGNTVTVTNLSVTAGTTIGAVADPFAFNADNVETLSAGDQILAETNTVNITANDLNAGAANTVTLAAGTFVLSAAGSILSKAAVGDGAGAPAVLAGVGNVAGNLSVASDGTTSPAGPLATGIITTTAGDFTLVPGAKFQVQVNGTLPGSAHDQVVVNGAVNLGGATLDASGTIASFSGQTIVLISNDGIDPVVGEFAGLPNGSLITLNDVANPGKVLSFTINYNDGNDVTLRQVDTFVRIDGSGNLVVEDIFTVTNDNITIQSDTANNRYIISDPGRIIGSSVPGSTGSGTSTVFVPFAAVTGPQIQVNTFDGNDKLTLDVALGNFSKAVVYDGGAGADDLVLTGVQLGGAPFASVAHAFTSDSTGSVDVTGNGQIQYQGLESISNDQLNANDRTFTFNSGAEAITVTDSGGADGKNAIDSVSGGVPVTFTNPNVSLTINAGTGADSVTVTSIDAGYKASLTIDGGNDTDSVRIDPALALGSATSTGTVTITGESITLNNSITNTTATVSGPLTFTGATKLGVPVTLTTQNAPVTFNGTVDSEANEANALTVNAGSKNVTFNGSVGTGAGKLGALEVNSGGTTMFAEPVTAASVTTDGPGTTAVNGGAITTTGAQTFNDPVTLGKDVTFKAGTSLTFAKTLDGNVTVNANASGATTFGGAVNVGALTTDAGGGTFVNGGSVKTSGFQTYNDAVTVNADTTFDATGTLTFNDTLGGAKAVTAKSPAATTFNKGVNVGSLSTDAAGTTVINGGAVTTTGAQTYGDPVSLGTNTTFNAGSDVTFDKTLTGAVNVAVNAAGITKFQGAVDVGTLTTDAAGTTAINGGTVKTAGAQTYGDPVSLGTNTTFNADGALTFSQTLTGTVDVNANSPVATTFQGAVSVGSLTTDAAGGTFVNGGAVTTTGSQTYNDPVSVGKDALFTAGSDVTFGQTLTGAVNVAVNAAGITKFQGAVDVGSLTTDAAGTTAINGGTVKTAGAQTYGDNISLGTNTTFTAGTDISATAGVTAQEKQFTVASARNVTLAGTITVNQLTQQAGSGTFALNGNASVGSGGTQLTTKAVTLNADLISVGDVTFNPQGGGVTQTAGRLTTPHLLLTGSGDFKLDQPGNDIQIGLRFNTTGGIVCIRDTNGLVLDFSAGPLTSDNKDVFLRSQGDFTAEDPAAATKVDLTTLIDLGTGRMFVQPGLGAPAKVLFDVETKAGGVFLGTPATLELTRVATQLAARGIVLPADFCGAPGGGNNQGDSYTVRPSVNSRIVIFGNDPIVAPGDSLKILRLEQTVIQNFQFNGKDGFADFGNGNRKQLDFFNIESIAGRAFAGYVVLLAEAGDATGSTQQQFAIRVTQTVQGRAVPGGVDGVASQSNPFVVSPAAVNPIAPGSAPRLAIGNVGASATPDLVIVNGSGAAPLVTVIDGDFLNAVDVVDPVSGAKSLRLRTVDELFRTKGAIMAQFFAYDPTFLGGVNIAIGDLDGDRTPEIITGADIGGGPHVRSFELRELKGAAAANSFTPFTADDTGISFFAYESTFTGGVRVAVGDVNSDGRDDLILGAGLLGGPRVRVISGKAIEDGSFLTIGADGKKEVTNVIADFFVFEPSFRGGIYVGGGNFNQKGASDVVVGAGVGGGSRVRVLDGDTIRNGASPTELANFFAFPPNNTADPLFGTAINVGGVGGVAFGGLDLTGSTQTAGTPNRLTVLVSTSRGPVVQVEEFVIDSDGKPSRAFTRPPFKPEDTLLSRATQDQNGKVISSLTLPGVNPLNPNDKTPVSADKLTLGATVGGFFDPGAT